MAVGDASPQAPRMRAPDLIGATGGFGWRMVTHLARTTAVIHLPTGGKTVSAFPCPLAPCPLPGSARPPSGQKSH
ncbi:hypothetical protein [Streptomyces anulatus]|uniref:hypothetical protein n=1 Tax=Streptomyces anulatus TaxID=1892 RepID=UPI00386D765B